MTIRSQGRPFVFGGYKALIAQERGRALNAKANVERRLQPGNLLRGNVMDYLKLRYSPEQIAGTLKLIHPHAPSLQVSYETIYTALYAMPRGELKTDVVGYLKHGLAKRRPMARGEDRRGKIPDMVNIRDRSLKVEERRVPEHWEGDLIKCAYNRSSIWMLVQRTTFYMVLTKMETATAESAVEGVAFVLNRIEAKTGFSMTYNQFN